MENDLFDYEKSLDLICELRENLEALECRLSYDVNIGLYDKFIKYKEQFLFWIDEIDYTIKDYK